MLLVLFADIIFRGESISTKAGGLSSENRNPARYFFNLLRPPAFNEETQWSAKGLKSETPPSPLSAPLRLIELPSSVSFTGGVSRTRYLYGDQKEASTMSKRELNVASGTFGMESTVNGP